MKATELMIGDWVCYNKANGYITQPQRICSTSDEDNSFIRCARDDRDPLKEKYPVDDFNTELLSPVALTAEILQRDGFRKFDFNNIENQHQWTWWLDTLTNVSLWCRELKDDPKDGWMIRIESPLTSCCCKIEHVHELQHALRLCNIDKEILL